MSNNIVWGQPNCAHCDTAKKLLQEYKIPFEYRELRTIDDKAEFFEVTNGARTVPQIILKDQLIGGLSDLRKALNANI